MLPSAILTHAFFILKIKEIRVLEEYEVIRSLVYRCSKNKQYLKIVMWVFLVLLLKTIGTEKTGDSATATM